jgi:4-nitrophenyl phosphatase
MEMLNQLSPAIHGLILDMDGVLWKDASPIGDLASIFKRIRDTGLQVMLATNNATLTVDEYLQKLNGFGVKLSASQIITSSIAAADALIKEFPQKGNVFVVGENGILGALSDAGFAPITDPDDQTPVVAVVAGLDRNLTYQKLKTATFHVRDGAKFYGTNIDPTLPTPDGLVPGAGSVIAALETAAGVKPIVIGKPSPFMFELAAERMKLSPREILVIGDRLETDIAGGQSIMARTALVLSGASTSEQAGAWKPQPDLIAPELAEIIGE